METKTGKVTEAPISIGVVVNFATQTVEGFGPPIKIFVNQTTIGFDKFDRWPNPSERTMGTIDRVTGEASVFFADKIISGTYSLKCQPDGRGGSMHPPDLSG